jgi:tetratricopeptide (TPR) repeat protein
LGASQIFGQIPDKFTNLQVLPKDLGKRELLETMKNFTRALGVRCQFCHIGEEGKPLVNLAQQLQAGGKSDDALAILNLNAEFYPNSWMVYFQLAEIFLKKGDKVLAQENYRKSLALNPENSLVQKKLEDLTTQPK